MKLLRTEHLADDFWGGLASMLVALPASIAFGVAIYSPLGAGAAAQGAIAGILGAMALGIVAPLFGGTERLISAPCAPAAAVMGSLAVELISGSRSGTPLQPGHALLIMMLVALLAAGLQIFYGTIGGGTLIKYIPYPVVTGYLSGVGVVIFLKQLPGFLGLPKGTAASHGVATPALWNATSLVVGLATIVVMLLAPRITRKVPAAILGLFGGGAAYFAMGFARPELRSLDGNPLLIGRLAGGDGSFLSAFAARFAAFGEVSFADLQLVVVPALTLSILLSIDTLKTCVLVDALTRSRHDSNREMIGQGLANLTSALVGGMPGAGTSGPTLVNIASGGKTRLSSVLEGSFSLVAYLSLAGLIAWAPIAALAGILIVVAYRMVDWTSLRLLRQRSTILDFVVVASVIAVAVSVGLIAASGVGVALAILLFIRDQVKGTVIRRMTYGNQVFSRQRRLPEEIAILEAKGGRTLVVELDGNLFFGTTDQLLSQLEGDLKTCQYLILDMHRVRSMDLTAAHLLEQIEAQLSERGAHLLFSAVPRTLPSGQDLRAYFDEVGLVRRESHARVFNQLSDALEWAEDEILRGAGLDEDEEAPLELREIDFLRGRKEETLRELEECIEERRYQPGERIFAQGDQSDEIYLIRRGTVRIVLRLKGGGEYHVATCGQGDFFGDMAFLDAGARSADAVAATPTDLFVISRERFENVAAKHPRLGQQFFAGLARSLAIRMRHADGEIRALEEA